MRKDELITDLATAVGLIGAFAVVVIALMLGEGGVGLFLNPAAFLIVYGGSTFIVLMQFNLRQFLGAIRIAFHAFFLKHETPEQLIELALTLQKKARLENILALEKVEIANPFFRKGIQYLVDGVELDIVKSTMLKEMFRADERHETGRLIFKSFSEVCPAMGMIGTLIGLVQMLSSLQDATKVGPAMAVALLTTLYGAVLGYMVAKPIADKLALRNREERLTKMLIIDAVIGLAEGYHPRLLEEMLMPYLPGARRERELPTQPGGGELEKAKT